MARLEQAERLMRLAALLLLVSVTAAQAQDATRTYRGPSLLGLTNPWPAPPRQSLIPEPVRIELPALSLERWAPDGNGGTFSIDSLQGQVVLVDIWTRTCIACIPIHNLLIRRSKEWEQQGVKIVSVLSGEDPAGLALFFDSHGGVPPFPVLLDPDDALLRGSGGSSYATQLLVDHHGRIAAFVKGGSRETAYLPMLFPSLVSAREWNRDVSP